MARKIVTLYIDDNSLRLLITHGKRIKKWADLPLEPGLVKNSLVIEKAEVAAKVKQLFKAQKVRRKKVIVGLSGMHCLTRPITLPLLPRAMLAEAVTREAKRVLPVPIEQFYILWQTISASEEKIQVFLVAVPRTTADALLKVLRQAGLKPYLMDLKPLALARVVKEATAVIIDVQPTEFDIVIMAGGVPQPIRTLPFPSKALSQQEKLLMIRDELSRTIKFYNSNNPEKPLTPDVTVFVSGELADEPELHKSLSDELGYPVLPLPSPLKFPEQLDLTRYIANIGLVLKELSSGRDAGPSVANLNVLPTPYRAKPISLVRVVALPSAVVIIGLLVLLAMLAQDASGSIASTYNQLHTTNQLLIQRQLQRQELAKDIAELERKLTEVEASRYTFTTALASLGNQGSEVNGDLVEVITKSLPSTINLTSISHNLSILTISGRAPSETDILSYARNIDDSGRFSETIIASIKKTEDDRMDFTLVLKK